MVSIHFKKQGLPTELCQAQRLGVAQLVPLAPRTSMRTGGLGPPFGAGHWEPRFVTRRAPGRLTQGCPARPDDRYPGSHGSECQRGPEGHGEMEGQVAGQLRQFVPLEAIQGEWGEARVSSPNWGYFWST